MAIPASPAPSNFNSEQVWRHDRDHFLHPWTHFDSFKAEGSLVIAEGKGAYVYDSTGKRYLDGIGGLWCVNIGYGNEEMVQAIADQARRLAFFSSFVDTTNPPAAELAAKLAELAPGDLNHVCYTCTGSDANDTAVRLAHYYHARRGQPSKKHIIARLDGYHGSTYLGMSLTGRKGDRSPNFHYLTDFVHHVSSPNSYRRPAGMTVGEFCDHLVGELEQTIQAIGPDNVAAFIAEPVLGAGGVIVPPPGYHRRMAELCRRYDVLYVADEVVTAFGRLGHFFASKAVFDSQPDIIVTAKGISSGYIPLGAAIFSDAIHEVISAPDPDAWFTHGFTYSVIRWPAPPASRTSRSSSARRSASMCVAPAPISSRSWRSSRRCRWWATCAEAISCCAWRTSPTARRESPCRTRSMSANASRITARRAASSCGRSVLSMSCRRRSS